MERRFRLGRGRVRPINNLAARALCRRGQAARVLESRGSRGHRPECWVPLAEPGLQGVVEHRCSALQQQVSSAWRPARLLLLDHALAHHLVHRRVDERRADRLALAPAVGRWRRRRPLLRAKARDRKRVGPVRLSSKQILLGFLVAAEYEATQLYTQLAESTNNKLAVKVLKEIADEELVHVGEFQRLLRELAPGDEKLYAKGAREVEGKLKKTK